ncbi:UNVERIFIED_CONTAM: hypothetical protein GTU68_031924 [Idotea baltica]|nr:hypothetical protein [Idotea baltica]
MQKFELINSYSKKFNISDKVKRLELETGILKNKLKSGDKLIILDEHAKQFSSVDFAKWLNLEMNFSQNITFAIGGPYGWDDSIRKSAYKSISLSPMTFTAQMARLIFLEQLYRAFTINKGLPYHK